MKTAAARPVNRGWKWKAPALAAISVIAGACSSQGSKDGSQTHFTAMGEDTAAEPTADVPADTGDDQGDSDVPAPDAASDDDTASAVVDDDSTVSDDDSTNAVSDDDSALPTDDDSDVPPDALPDLPGDDETSTDDDIPATAPNGNGGAGGSTDACPGGECDTPEGGTGPIETVYDPCSGKHCGDTCAICDPSLPNCVEPGATVCDTQGQCSAEPIECRVESPLCSATSFEDTDDGCVEESWLWDGGQCAAVTHCGCAAGDCERLYPDAASCESAHAACLPRGCEAQDATTGAAMCGTLLGYAFDGADCNDVLCQCFGEDCGDIEPTLEACEARFGTCLARTDECVDTEFPVESTDPGYQPAYPSIDFSIDGYDSLYDSESETVAAFADWTQAKWLGWEETGDGGPCAPFVPLRFTFECPAPRPLLLEVDGEVVQLNVTLLWDSWVVETEAPEDVEVRIEPHASGTLVLQIKDPATELPVLIVVKGRDDVPGADVPWEFDPFTFTADEIECNTAPDACDWTFSALDLRATTAEDEETLTRTETLRMSASGEDFAVAYGYILKQSAASEQACATLYSWHQNFAVLRIPPE